MNQNIFPSDSEIEKRADDLTNNNTNFSNVRGQYSPSRSFDTLKLFAKWMRSEIQRRMEGEGGEAKYYVPVKKKRGVYAVDLDYQLRYHENDLSKIMKPDECRLIGTKIQCMEFIVHHLAHSKQPTLDPKVLLAWVEDNIKIAVKFPSDGKALSAFKLVRDKINELTGK